MRPSIKNQNLIYLTLQIPGADREIIIINF